MNKIAQKYLTRQLHDMSKDNKYLYNYSGDLVRRVIELEEDNARLKEDLKELSKYHREYKERNVNRNK